MDGRERRDAVFVFSTRSVLLSLLSMCWMCTQLKRKRKWEEKGGTTTTTPTTNKQKKR
jgi:hypothetical protein